MFGASPFGSAVFGGGAGASPHVASAGFVGKRGHAAGQQVRGRAASQQARGHTAPSQRVGRAAPGQGRGA